MKTLLMNQFIVALLNVMEIKIMVTKLQKSVLHVIRLQSLQYLRYLVSKFNKY